MIDLAASLEATAIGQFLKASRWVYPLVNAGHVLGIALLIGSVVPMDLRLLGVVSRPGLAETVALLRPFAAAGLALAVICGALLFVTQAGDYLQSRWFQAKMLLVALAALNAALHPRLAFASRRRQVVVAGLSLALWPVAMLCGRMIAYF